MVAMGGRLFPGEWETISDCVTKESDNSSFMHHQLSVPNTLRRGGASWTCSHPSVMKYSQSQFCSCPFASNYSCGELMSIWVVSHPEDTVPQNSPQPLALKISAPTFMMLTEGEVTQMSCLVLSTPCHFSSALWPTVLLVLTIIQRKKRLLSGSPRAALIHGVLKRKGDGKVCLKRGSERQLSEDVWKVYMETY